MKKMDTQDIEAWEERNKEPLPETREPLPEPSEEASDGPWWAFDPTGPWAWVAIIIAIPLLPLIGLIGGIIAIFLFPLKLLGMAGNAISEAKERSDVKKEANKRIAEEGVHSVKTVNQTFAHVDVHGEDVDEDEDVVLEACEIHEDEFRVYSMQGEKLHGCARCGH